MIRSCASTSTRLPVTWPPAIVRKIKDKRLAANCAPLKIMAKNVGAISLA
jgi:hypothetical protein